MAAEYDIYKQVIHSSIDLLMQKGYLSHDLDWDVKGGKFTLRIRGVNFEPMAAVALITFNRWRNTIVLFNAVTDDRSEYPLICDGKKVDKDGFLKFIIEYAKKLNEESAYLKL